MSEDIAKIVSRAETRAALADTLVADAEKRRAAAETALIAAQARIETLERTVDFAEARIREVAAAATVAAMRACSEVCDLYLADKPSNEATRAGYVNAAMGIQGRIDAMAARAANPGDDRVARLLARGKAS